MRLITPFVLGFAALLVPTFAGAQAPATAVKPIYKLQLAADWPEAIYKPGEEATYSVQLLDGDKPASSVELNYTLSLDGHKTLSTGKTMSTDRPFSIKGMLAEPGFCGSR